MSKLEVDAIEPQSGTTLTIGASGDSVNIASGASITDFTSTGIDDNGTATAITIDSSENVGIGTASPSEKLQISGGDLLLDRGSSTSSLTRKITIGGTRNGSASKYAELIFQNYDVDGSAVDYAGASIGAHIDNDATDGGELVFATSTSTSGVTEHMRLDSSGNLKFNSGYGSVATAYGCRAWVKFDGTGTPAINNSGNVSSITDNGTGKFTLNFTTTMPDADFSVVAIGGFSTDTANQATYYLRSSTTTSVRIHGTANNSLAFVDFNRNCVAVFR